MYFLLEWTDYQLRSIVHLVKPNYLTSVTVALVVVVLAIEPQTPPTAAINTKIQQLFSRMTQSQAVVPQLA